MPPTTSPAEPLPLWLQRWLAQPNRTSPSLWRIAERLRAMSEPERELVTKFPPRAVVRCRCGTYGVVVSVLLCLQSEDDTNPHLEVGCATSPTDLLRREISHVGAAEQYEVIGYVEGLTPADLLALAATAADA